MSEGPDADVKRCAKCAAWIPSTATKCSYCDTSSPDVPLGRASGSVFSLRHGVNVTDALIAVNVACFFLSLVVAKVAGIEGNLLQWALTGKGFQNGAYLSGATYQPAVAAGEWWRLVTANYLHFGLIHIGFNLFALRELGRVAERIYGPARMLVVWAISGVGCAAAMCALAVARTNLPAGVGAGASGAVCGLLGLLLVYYRNADAGRAAAIRASLIRSGLCTLAIGLALPLGSTVGHLGGAVVGAGFGFILKDRFGRRLRAGQGDAWPAAAFLCVAGTLVAMGFAVHSALTLMGAQK